MRHTSFKIPIYDFKVTILQIESPKDWKEALVYFKNMKLEEESIYGEQDSITRGCTNGGSTYRNYDLREFLVVFYPMTDKNSLYNIYGHEKRHIEDRLMEWGNINDIEAPAFIAGFLNERFVKFMLDYKL